MKRPLSALTLLTLLGLALPLLAYGDSQPIPRIPVLVGDPWRICEMPDLGELNGPDPQRQHVVDHGFLQDVNGNWQLWACLRGTAISRLLYRWQGESLQEGPWKPWGVGARAQPRYDEQIRFRNGRLEETMGAPFFHKENDTYYMFYHSAGIRLMDSPDGIGFERATDDTGSNLLYPDGGRDVMVIRVGDEYYGYSTITERDENDELISYVKLKKSRDMRHWYGDTIVCAGGKDSEGPVAFESPFVQYLDGYYYLFRASSITFKTYVYRSQDPTYFGVNDDSNLIAEFDLKAPEILCVDGQWYISDLADFQGIMMYRLEWKAQN